MSMKYLAAPLLCHYAGNQVTKDSVIAVFNSIGAQFDEELVQHIVDYIAANGIEAALANGMTQLSSVPAGGAAAAAPAAAGGAAAAVAEAPVEEEEEEEEDMGFGLFD